MTKCLVCFSVKFTFVLRGGLKLGAGTGKEAKRLGRQPWKEDRQNAERAERETRTVNKI